MTTVVDELQKLLAGPATLTTDEAVAVAMAIALLKAQAAQPSQAGLSVDEILDIASKSIPADHPAEQVDILECAHALFAAINAKGSK